MDGESKGTKQAAIGAFAPDGSFRLALLGTSLPEGGSFMPDCCGIGEGWNKKKEGGMASEEADGQGEGRGARGVL